MLTITEENVLNSNAWDEFKVYESLAYWAINKPTLKSCIEIINALLSAIEKTPRWGISSSYPNAIQINDELEHKLAEIQGWLEDQKQEDK